MRRSGSGLLSSTFPDGYLNLTQGKPCQKHNQAQVGEHAGLASAELKRFTLRRVRGQVGGASLQLGLKGQGLRKHELVKRLFPYGQLLQQLSQLRRLALHGICGLSTARTAREKLRSSLGPKGFTRAIAVQACLRQDILPDPAIHFEQQAKTVSRAKPLPGMGLWGLSRVCQQVGSCSGDQSRPSES